MYIIIIIKYKRSTEPKQNAAIMRKQELNVWIDDFYLSQRGGEFHDWCITHGKDLREVCTEAEFLEVRDEFESETPEL